MAPRQRCGEVKAIVEIAFMAMFHAVSLHTFIIEQQPRVKNSYLVSTSSYLKHQISNIHNIPLVGPQEMPGGRKHVILNHKESQGEKSTIHWHYVSIWNKLKWGKNAQKNYFPLKI